MLSNITMTAMTMIAILINLPNNCEFYHLLINDTGFDTDEDEKWLLQANLYLISCVRAMMR